MHFSRSTAAAALAASLPFVAAQTSTSCSPLEKTCPADPGLAVSSFSSDFTSGSGAAKSWSTAQGTTLTYGDNGAEFTISKAGQAPTFQSDFYIFFGRVEVTMQAAPGTGIVSSIVLESDDLDEIDWEFLGGNTAQVETNFFGKGNTTVYDRAIYYSVESPQTTFHTYTIDWSTEKLDFIIDGTTVRSIPYSDPLALGGKNYPQTPMRVKLGNWAGGGPGEPKGTVQWAGGNTDFSQAPFTMYVKSVAITNYKPAHSYVYGDMSGSWQSIKMNGESSGGSSASGSASSAVPTKSLSVAPLSSATGVVVSKTVTGAAYSTNSASVSALNPSGSGVGSGTNPSATGSGSSSSPSASPTVASGNGASGLAALSAVSVLSAVLALWLS